TSAAAPDGRQLSRLVDKGNMSAKVWADSAYRSQRNEKWLARNMMNSQIHRRKPRGKPMAEHTARANAKKSSIRAAVEHVFAHQKNRFGLFIRTIGLARAEAKITLANLAYNFNRLIFHETRAAMG
ncbi:transposase, partial [Thalassospira profundimaris]